ncbi:MAG: cellulose biosynthesis cyclic di-GMP-binding regulatory protein BcsB, partial [Candidatus Atribacteria bacterium]|nr:cellulose biosynthesis cyclic di-GMP-binding regulatory protein BcsB [Candidatus Atribacteria bacterium]
MKKIFFALFFLFLFSLFSNPAFSQTGKIISWSFETNLGMDKDIKLEGSTPSHTFYLPNIPGGLWNQGILFLKVWFSEALNPESNISVYANDTLLSSHLLKNLNLLPGNIAFVEIPFSSAPISDGDEGVKIDIKPSLFISRNICEDLASGNLWMAIKKESFINLPTSPRDPQNISEFLRSIGNDFEIVLPPEEWSREIMHSYIMLYSFLRRTFRSRPFTIRTTTTPQQNTGSNPPPDQPKIFLLNNAVSDFQFLGKNLFLTTKG